MKLPAISILSLAVLSGVSHAGLLPVGVTIDYVTVGSPGNLADGSTFGAVSYAYQIAKNEVTISQYAAFLNAVAATDTYGLYSASMTTSYINGISQSGSSGSFTYAVNPGSEKKPITYVSWFDAARFTNWLHHGTADGCPRQYHDGRRSLHASRRDERCECFQERGSRSVDSFRRRVV